MKQALPKMRTSIFLLTLILLFSWGQKAAAQTTINTTFTNNNGSGMVTFNFVNNGASAVIITEIGSICGAATTQTVTAWYKPGAINGLPGRIETANGWTQFGSGTITGVTNSSTTTAQVFFPTATSTLTQITIPAGATYGIAVSATNLRYSTLTAGTYTASGGGCDIVTGTNIGYGGVVPPTAPTLTPRGFIGYVTFIPSVACSGTPTGGTAQVNGSSGTVGVCSSIAANFSITGGTNATGITYQWQYSATGAGGSYTDIPGATSSSYTIASYGAGNAGYYQRITTCTSSAQSATSVPVQLTTNAVAACYCSPTTTGATSKYISNFTTTGGVVNINNTSPAGSASGYEDYHATVSGSAYHGTTVNYSISVSTGTSGRAIWIDFDEDGIFQSSEQVVTGTTTYGSSPLVGSFTIPAGATPGTKRMRILASNVPANPTTPCAITSTGEYEDYSFEVLAYTPCAGTPAGDTAVANGNSGTIGICPSIAVNLSVSGGTTGSGLTYQWEYSATGAGGSYNNIAGATSSNYAISSYSSANAGYYQLVTTCANSGVSVRSTVVELTTNALANCYCSPTTTGGATSFINRFTTTGGVSNIDNISGNSTPGYTDFHASVSGSAYQGTTISYSIGIPSSTYGRAIWMDLNEDGIFQTGEQLVSSTAYSSPAGAPLTGTFTIPAGTTPGTKRLRILASLTPNNPSNPCANTGSGEYEDYSFEVLANTLCAGTPAAAVAAASGSSTCSGAPFILSASGTPIGQTGITYQWQSSPAGAGTFSDIAGATTIPYVVTSGQTAPTDYRLLVICSNGGLSTPSNTVALGINPFNVCYCNTGLGGSTSAAITGATILGSTFDHNGGPSASPFYTQFPATGTNTGTLTQGLTYTINTTHSSTGFASLWIDYDHSGTFDAGEWTQINTATSTSGSISFTVPAGALTGQTGMRIRTRTTAHTGADACTNFTTGETKDFIITIAAPVPCSGAPATTIAASVTNACYNAPFDLSVSGIPAGTTGLTYQWQSRPAGGGVFTDIAGATIYPYTMTGQAAATDYQLVVTCANGGATATSNMVSVGQNPANTCYCVPTATSTGGGSTKYISNFTTTGGVTDINNTSTGSASGYTDFHATASGSAYAGTTINYSISVSTGTSGYAVWVDVDEDGTFQAGEQIVSSSAYASSPITGSFTIPILTAPGTKRMRILISNTPNNPSDPCTVASTGEYEDYTFTILPPPACSGTPTAGTASAAMTALCANSTADLSLTGFTGSATPIGGITFQWEEASSVGGPYTAVSGGAGGTTPYFTSDPLTVTTYYRAVVTCTNSGQSATSNVLTITVNNPQPAGTTPAARCGVGTVTLGATPAAGQTIGWYAAATGGTPLATGNSFTTPVISSSTTYYAAAQQGGSTGVTGRTTATALGSGFSSSIYNLNFTLTQSATFNSIDLFSGTGTAVTVSLYDATGTTQLFTTGSVTTPTNSQNTIPLGWTLAPGTYKIAFLGMTGTFFRENPTAGSASVGYPIPLTVGGTQVGAINGYASSLTAAVSSSQTVYYFGYNWNISTGCEGTRVPVVATVNTPPALAITSSQAVCSGNAAMLEVTTNTASFDTYSWSPTTDLFTDAAGTIPYTGQNLTTVYVVSAAPIETLYTLNASNSTTQCVSQTTSSVAILPVAPTVSAAPASLCVSGTTTLSLSPATDYGVALLQWQESPDGISFTDIAGATSATYTTGTLTSTTYFRMQIRNSDGTICTEPQVTVMVDNPTVSNPVPATRCGDGTVTLSATPSVGATLNWYAAATGGAPLATGNSFTTPVLTATTNYYVAAGAGASSATAGRITPQATSTGYNFIDYGMVFDASQAFVLTSVDVFPTATAGSMTIELQNNAGVMLQTGTFAIPAGTGTTFGTGATPYTLNLNFNVPAGTGYRLITTAQAASVIRDNPISGFAYPLPIGTVGQLTAGWLGGSPSATTYYYFYNWQVMVGCESPRTQVTATVNAAPVLTLSNATQTVCNNGIAAVSVTSPLANFDTYIWTPAANLYTDAAATVPYTAGASATTIYVKSATAGNASYTLTASNSNTLCSNIETTTVNVLPAVSVTIAPASICVSGTPTATLVGGPTFTSAGATIAWATSPDGITYTSTGTTGNSYTPGSPIVSNTYYQATVSFGGNTCGVDTAQAVVNNPVVSSPVSGNRCGPGTVTLSATPSAGATLNWYTAATGGTPVATGNSFTTPVISSTTNYYVSAGIGSTTSVTGKVTATAPGTAFGSSIYSLVFTLTQSATFNSVDLFSGTGTAVTVSLYDAPGTSQLYTTGSVTTPPNAQNTIPLGWALAPGTYRLAFQAMTGTYFRENSGFTYPLDLSVGGNSIGSIAGYATSLTQATPTTGSSYYFGYNWNMSTGCESGRTLVTATINSAPAVAISGTQTVCSGGAAQLTVTTGAADYDTYSWTPTANLFVDAAGATPYTGQNVPTVYAIATAAGTTNYTLNASNSITGCTNIDSAKVTVLPAAPTVVATPAQLCFSGTSTLTLNPATGYGAATYQWQESVNGTTFTNISGATAATYTTPTITASHYYRVQIKNGAGTVCTEPQVQVIVNTPAVSNPVPGSRCSPGQVTLSATPSAGATLNWYTAATGGVPVGTGNSFTTPSISTTTNYYASAEIGSSTSVTGRLASAAPGAATTLSNYNLVFTLTKSATLNSVDVFSGTGTSITAALYNSGGTAVVAGTSPVTTATTTNAQNTLNLGWAIAPGTYRLAFTSMTGNFFRESSGTTYPIALSVGGTQVGTIIGYGTSLTAATSTGAAYYFGYNWNMTTGCQSPRTMVTATVNTPPAITTQPVATTTRCENGNFTLSVAATNATSYQWNLGGTPIPGATASSYAVTGATAANAGTYTVTVTGAASCTTTVTSSAAAVTISPAPVITTQPSAQTVCEGTTLTLDVVASNATGYQWYRNGAIIVGANSSTYTVAAAALANGGTYYVAVSGDAPCAAVNSNTVAVTINAAPSGSFAYSGSPYCGSANPATPTGNALTAGGTYSSTAGLNIDATTGEVTPALSAGGTYTVTYTVAAANGCNAYSTTANVVIDEPVVTLTAASATTNCGDPAIELTVLVTGTSSPVLSWNTTSGLYTDQAATIPYNGTALVSPLYAKLSSDLEYSVTATVNGCSSNSTSTAGIEVTGGTTGIASATSTSNQVYSQMGQVDIRNANCEIIASVLPGSGTPISGLVDVNISVLSGTQLTAGGQPYVGRLFYFEPVNNAATATASITLYVTQAEFDTYTTAVTMSDSPAYWSAAPANSADQANAANIRVSQFHGNGLPGTTPGHLITPSSVTYNSTLGAWEITIPVSGFSNFFVHTNNSLSTPLPVTFTAIAAHAEEGRNRIDWTVGVEDNVSRYEVEKEVSGNFVTIGKLPAVGQAQYVYYDQKPVAGRNVYRVRAVDVDGRFGYSAVAVVVINDGRGFSLELFPNPTRDVVTVRSTGSNAKEATVTVSELSGRMILRQTVKAGEDQIDLSVLPSGTYMVQWNDGVHKESVRVTRQ